MKVMVVFGTRPEAVKMAPLVKLLMKQEDMHTAVCVTAQHREMLDQVLGLFDIVPHYDLDIMQERQTLTDITIRALKGLEGVIEKEKPDVLLVHGDTTTTFAGSLAGYYHGVKVGHVEAGLRTFNKFSPFPEEMNRKLTGAVADMHFAPTAGSRANLIREGVDERDIVVTGNTVIDALIQVIRNRSCPEIPGLGRLDAEGGRIVLLTCHRRENLGQPMKNIFHAVRDLVDAHRDVQLVFPVHKNPAVREIAYGILNGHDRIHLIEPLDYLPFAHLMNKSHIILTDSGGIQEEAPSLGKPVLVLREVTERPEALEAGTVRLAGTCRMKIFELASRLLEDDREYRSMAEAVNPYGDGTASERIVDALRFYCGLSGNPPRDFIPEDK
ncbi:MAG: UDP-N-acetylglucosamine 2-epimerase [Firmicutes bacterium]|nr:UDP-N-acetylglucosamine 2-epimerase [Bacillota bacterium]